MKPLTIKDLTLDDALRDLLPPRSPEEFEELKRQIRADGEVRNPLVVWGPVNTLIDGYGRRDAWKELRDEGVEIPPPPITKNNALPDLDAVKLWMIREQLGRRNLQPKAAALLRGRLYQELRKATGRPEEKRSQNDYVSDQDGRTAEAVAKATGVSASTAQRDAAYADALDAIGLVNPKFKSDVTNGTLKLPKKDVIDLSKLPREEMVRAFKDIRLGYDWREALPKNGTPTREPGDDTDSEKEARAASRRNGKPSKIGKAVEEAFGAVRRQLSHAQAEWGKSPVLDECLARLSGAFASWEKYRNEVAR